MSKLQVYAWSKPGVTNFGDEMGPDILARLGHTVERVPVAQAEVVTIGSVMHHMAAAPEGCIVAGAGIMHAHNVGLDVSHLDVRIVRGSLTVKAIDWEDDNILPLVGDPAILAADIYSGPGTYKSTQRKYRVGWVPHYMDNRIITEANVVINPLDPPAQVVSQISQCEYILTSSLHALIVAQAFSIPAQRLAHPRVLGGDTKWIDYASGYAHGDKESIYSVLEGL